MKIGELAERTGLTAHTVRYYERIGLLPPAPRGSSKQREYDNSILPWIDFLGRMRTTGMSIQKMLHYAALRARGVSTEAERQALLVEHRATVRNHVAALQACLSVLDTKIAGYGDHDRMENTHDAQTSRRHQQVREGLARPL